VFFYDKLFVGFYRAAKIMASSGQQVTLTVAKQGALYHGLAMLICQDTPQMPPGMIATAMINYSVVLSSSFYMLALRV